MAAKESTAGVPLGQDVTQAAPERSHLPAALPRVHNAFIHGTGEAGEIHSTTFRLV